MVDMRKRFRGNAPISTSTELEAGADKNYYYQLYAGKPAGGSVRVSSGEDDKVLPPDEEDDYKPVGERV